MQKLCCVCTRQQFSASLDYFVTSSPPYLHQFSTISGGNCINNSTPSSNSSKANSSVTNPTTSVITVDKRDIGQTNVQTVPMTLDPSPTVAAIATTLANLDVEDLDVEDMDAEDLDTTTRLFKLDAVVEDEVMKVVLATLDHATTLHGVLSLRRISRNRSM